MRYTIYKDEEKISKIVSDYQTGNYGTRNLAKKYHASVKTISNILKLNNVELKPSGGQSKIDYHKEQIINLYNEGKSTCEIADMYNVDASTVLRLLKLSGIDTSRGLSQPLDTDIVENILIDYYDHDISMKKLAKKYNTNISTVFKYITNNGIPTKTSGGIYKLPEEQIVEQYTKEKLNTYKLSKMYDVSVKTICDVLRKHNTKRDNRQGSPNLRVDFWENIDEPAKAYFLGWLITDGSIYNKTTCLEINSSDEYILELYKNIVKCDAKIKRHYNHHWNMPGNNMDCISYTSHFRVYCSRWIKDLAKYSIVPNKTFTCTFPILSDDMMPHFIRGCIDGDGSIGKNGDLIGFCGNYQMVSGLRDYLCSKLGVAKCKICKHNSIWTIIWGSKKDVNTIGNYIYKDKGDLFLKRKFDKWVSNPNNYLVHDLSC